MKIFNSSYHELDKSLRMKILVVYNAWRGAFDTLKLFVDSLDSFPNITSMALDWKKDSWILAEPEIVDFSTIDEVARSFECDIVLMLGSCLRLSEPAPKNHEITYASYYISTINNEKNKVENFGFAHHRYTAHSYNMREGFMWLPTSVNTDVFDLYSRKNTKGNDGKFLCLWNQSFSKGEARIKMLAELGSQGVRHQCFGSLTKNAINSYEAMKKMRQCRAVIDDNRDGVSKECQYNDRFSSACALQKPVIAHKCKDLDECFSSYLHLKDGMTLSESLTSLTDQEMEQTAEQNHKEIKDKHRNEYRWAEIIKNHTSRINK
jgi:hypothetical protein